MDQSGLLNSLVSLLTEHQVTYCVIGGQAVNAYAEPLVSLDLDIVLSANEINKAELLFKRRFDVRRFSHGINVLLPGSDLRVQIQTDPRYLAFLEHASPKDVLGLTLPVARVEDVLQGKLWAVADQSRPGSKRQKDLADIARLVEAYPHLGDLVPEEVLRLLL